MEETVIIEIREYINSDETDLFEMMRNEGGWLDTCSEGVIDKYKTALIKSKIEFNITQ